MTTKISKEAEEKIKSLKLQLRKEQFVSNEKIVACAIEILTIDDLKRLLLKVMVDSKDEGFMDET